MLYRKTWLILLLVALTALWGCSDDDDPVISWRKVRAQGIDSLGNWIQRRHLDLFRSKGIG